MSSLLPISSHAIICGAIERTNILIASGFGTLSITSVLIPISFCGIPLYIAAISPLSSTTPTVCPLNLPNPLLKSLIISLNNVVFPHPWW